MAAEGVLRAASRGDVARVASALTAEVANAVRLQLHALAYNLCVRRLADAHRPGRDCAVARRVGSPSARTRSRRSRNRLSGGLTGVTRRREPGFSPVIWEMPVQQPLENPPNRPRPDAAQTDRNPVRRCGRYTGVMEVDEPGTLERLKANRNTIFDPHVTNHGGRVFKLMGDGALVEFSSVVAAGVACEEQALSGAPQRFHGTSFSRRVSCRPRTDGKSTERHCRGAAVGSEQLNQERRVWPSRIHARERPGTIRSRLAQSRTAGGMIATHRHAAPYARKMLEQPGATLAYPLQAQLE
jgi:hypothetical protein